MYRCVFHILIYNYTSLPCLFSTVNLLLKIVNNLIKYFALFAFKKLLHN